MTQVPQTSPPPPRHDVLVLGAGPAGVVAARGLRAAGYSVALVGAPRPFDAFEGLSERAAEGLGSAGCHEALGRLGAEVRRVATWNGETSDANRETLVDRQAFDAGLRRDAAAAGATVLDGRIKRVEETAEGWRVTGRAGENQAFDIEAGFLVEARGRAAPAGGAGGRRGPATTALIRRWRLPSGGAPRTALAAFESGWCWFADLGTGEALFQVMAASGSGELPARPGLEVFYDDRLATIPEAAVWLAEAAPLGGVQARAAGPVLAGTLLGPTFARVGDAAFAVDPLSGNGMFQAVAVALALPAVVNTLIRRPQDRALAESFYRERVEQTFQRMCRVGRDFYRAEERWPRHPFWRARAAWPDEQAAHEPWDSEAPKLSARPVSQDGFIVRQPVIVTPDHPRGVWRVGDVPLLPLMEFLAGDESQSPAAAAAKFGAQAGYPAVSVETALSWLTHRGLAERVGGTIRLHPAPAAQLLKRQDGGPAEA
ncbi:MAG: FAD-dependent oxidoreductase [Rhodospirillales bacterium]|nr:FAD-dependent oxidoreductase [Rhodospirillales bacterium]